MLLLIHSVFNSGNICLFKPDESPYPFLFTFISPLLFVVSKNNKWVYLEIILNKISFLSCQMLVLSSKVYKIVSQHIKLGLLA